MTQNLYTCSPREVRKFIEEDVFPAGLVPFVEGPPGVGKSTIMRNVGEAWNLQINDHRLSTSDPTDLSGLPRFVTKEDGREIATFAPFDLFPTSDTSLPEGKDGWLLFFDEFNSAEKEVQAACYKIILDKKIGQYDLHPRVVIAAAGNRAMDRAITNNLSTAMQSRLVHIELEFNFREFNEDVMIAQDWDERIIAFLNYNPDQAMDFRPDHHEKTFNCPRTWEFMNKLIKNKSDDHIQSRKQLYAGTISSGSAVSFASFVEVYKTLLSIKEVLADPEGVPVPVNQPERAWAIISHLAKKVDEKTFEPISKFINRMDLSMRVLFYRTTLIKFPQMRTHPAFVKAAIEIQRYLRD